MSVESLAVRQATDAEVAFFRENGWAHLPGLVPADVIADLRATALARLAARDDTRGTAVDEAFGQSRDIAETDPQFRALTLDAGLGRTAARLLHGVRTVRVQVTNLLVKEPESAGGHGPTVFHQDFPWMPMDRSAMLTFWVALGDIPAAMGSLRFYTGSHREGLLGRSFVREGDDQPSQHPWLDGLPLSEPLDLRAGDATVHHALTVHGASANRLDRPRLSFTVTYFDSESLYTGSPYKQTDDLGLTVNGPFDHPRFPEVGA